MWVKHKFVFLGISLHHTLVGFFSSHFCSVKMYTNVQTTSIIHIQYPNHIIATWYWKQVMIADSWNPVDTYMMYWGGKQLIILTRNSHSSFSVDFHFNILIIRSHHIPCYFPTMLTNDFTYSYIHYSHLDQEKKNHQRQICHYWKYRNTVEPFM